MKNRLHILFLMITLGFFMAPTFSYACGTKVEKGCCKKEVPSKIKKKDCCKNKSSKDQDNGCEGKCGHSNCTSSSVTLSVVLPNKIEFTNNNFDFSNERKVFYQSESFIAAGFTSIWLIPKIG